MSGCFIEAAVGHHQVVNDPRNRRVGLAVASSAVLMAGGLIALHFITDEPWPVILIAGPFLVGWLSFLQWRRYRY
jgi:hypothetical protein